MLASVGLLLLIGGCPNPSGANQEPVASAGADQSVLSGALVTLSGTASTDPDGDSLTFAWSQTGGTAVTLSNANTASPTFTAPGAATTLVFPADCR